MSYNAWEGLGEGTKIGYFPNRSIQSSLTAAQVDSSSHHIRWVYVI